MTALLNILLTSVSVALRCRTDDGPSEAELKRVTRNCMRKLSENYMQTTLNGHQQNQHAQQHNKEDENANSRTNADNGGDYLNYNQRNQFQSHENYNNNNNNNSTRYNNRYNNKSKNSNNNNSTDSFCLAHCFFEQMQMLNNRRYPDQHKVLYVLTKDIRDRELRNFYTDTIHQCFHYLESQHRRDKCQFSRDLINCMTEYAKGNCDDWNDI
uniref:Uncharacterized protein n=1 Tax=Glossina morsitans morsitans TaxID=37546 RepID=A0A1B0FQ79_GLOMM